MGYADDQALVISRWSGYEVRSRAKVAIERISLWLNKMGLQLAPEKTESLILVGELQGSIEGVN